METETQTRRVGVQQTVPGRFHVHVRGVSLSATREELQAIVQEACDKYGVLAQPWTDGGAS